MNTQVTSHPLSSDLLPPAASIDQGASAIAGPSDFQDNSFAKALVPPPKEIQMAPRTELRERFTQLVLGSEAEKKDVRALFLNTSPENLHLVVKDICGDYRNRHSTIATTSLSMLGDIVVLPLIEVVREGGLKKVSEPGLIALKAFYDLGYRVQDISPENRKALKALVKELLENHTYCVSRMHAARIAGHFGSWHGHTFRRILSVNARLETDKAFAQEAKRSLERVSNPVERGLNAISSLIYSVRSLIPKF